MNRYRYSARDAEGKIHRGRLSAVDARSGRDALRARGLTPVEFSPAAQQAPQSVLRGRALANLSRELAALLGAGLPLAEAVDGLLEDAGQTGYETALSQVKAALVDGASPADAFASGIDDLPESYLAALTAGERSGKLAEVMARLADESEARQDLVEKLRMAFVYPAIVVVLALGAIVGLVAFLLPEIAASLPRQSGSLPWLTAMLLAVGDSLRQAGWIVLLVGTALLAFCWVMMRRSRRSWLGLASTLPLAGGFLHQLALANLWRDLALMVRYGIPLDEAVDLVAAYSSGLRSALTDASAQLQSGQSLSQSLAHARIGSSLCHRLVRTGERTGKLADMLDEVAVQEARRLRQRGELFVTFFEPAVIVLAGALVLLVALAILLPILQLNTEISL